MNAALRQARPSDALSVADVLLLSRKAFLPFAPLVHSDDEVRRWIATVLIPTGGVIVAVISEEVVGMMALSRETACGWIDQLYLHPSVVGRGIGSQLIERAKQELGSPIRLYTFQANTASRRFYERCGFRAIASSDGHANEERCPDVLYEYVGGMDIGAPNRQSAENVTPSPHPHYHGASGEDSP